MKITIHWDRVFGLGLAVLVVIIAIWSWRLFNESNQSDQQEIGQCDMQEAQKIVDNLVRSLALIFHSKIFLQF